jgi:hypothetical protein
MRRVWMRAQMVDQSRTEGHREQCVGTETSNVQSFSRISGRLAPEVARRAGCVSGCRSEQPSRPEVCLFLLAARCLKEEIVEGKLNC